jgi:hypothetical protein
MKGRRLVVWFIGLLFFLFLVLPLAASRTPTGAVLTTLPFGWWRFLKRNIPQITCDWGLIGTGVICTVLVLLVGNWFLGALWGQVQKRPEANQAPRKWRWPWTVCLYAAVWSLFLIAFGAAGVLRHTTWLLHDNQPWYEERLNTYVELRMAESTVNELLLENSQDLEKARAAILAERGYRRTRNPLCEDFNVILYGDGSNKVAAYLIIPRMPQLRAKGDFAAAAADGRESIRPLSQLQDTLSKMDAKYPAKTGP